MPEQKLNGSPASRQGGAIAAWNPDFYRGRRVFVTGHTGFKGSWMCRMLAMLGAEVTGYALEPPTDPSLFEAAGIARDVHSVTGDIRDFGRLKEAFDAADPEVVIHLAAQPIVRESYRFPRETYETNVMGTVNLMECVRLAVKSGGAVRSVLNVTTDKVYQNREWVWGYRESEPLDGFDPYSNSKSCSELVTHSYRDSFFRKEDGSYFPAVSTARAGNVIGGGDFAKDRIIPDCVRAAMAGKPVGIRNPNSTRPYQHVLEPVAAYLMIAAAQAEDPAKCGFYNVGPDECDCATTGELADLFTRCWGDGLTWEAADPNGPHEANFLKLDCSLLKSVFGWSPRWHLAEAVEKTVEWSRVFASGGDVRECCSRQIREFMGVINV
ncbi:MAG: CDP-glucose 4,6-dehydratase [Lachnospiraceae bacterium]|jgi:CDP-glucose 4,6-dehydratase